MFARTYVAHGEVAAEHDRGRVERVREQTHQEQLDPGIGRQLSGLEQGGRVRPDRLPGQPHQICRPCELEDVVSERDGDEDHRQTESGQQHVEHETDDHADQRHDGSVPALAE